MGAATADNRIDDEGAAAVAKALAQNSTLTSLDLAGKWVWVGEGLGVAGGQEARRKRAKSGLRVGCVRGVCVA